VNLRQFEVPDLRKRLHAGIRLSTGPFTTLIQSESKHLASMLARHYPDYHIADGNTFADISIGVEVGGLLRRNGMILLDGGTPFTDFPVGSELPYLEWGVNWCVATRAHQYLMLHAGVLEREGLALLLPGMPGSGKSTLCAYLMHHGWRLLSDEFGLLTGSPPRAVPFPRLIPLKNESIDVIKRLVPDAQLGPSFVGTRKGTVAHVCPPPTHVDLAEQTAAPALTVLPWYKQETAAECTEVSKSECFVELTKHSFNYTLRGRSGFETVAELVSAPCHRLVYGDLREAAAIIDELARPLWIGH
jgi:HprK-related kinase A